MIRLGLLFVAALSSCGAPPADTPRASFAGVPPLVLDEAPAAQVGSEDDGPASRPVRAVKVVARRDASPPAGGPFRYSDEQLRSGDLDRILTGAGPLWTLEEQADYHAEFADVAPYIVRLGISLQPIKRRTTEQVVAELRSYFSMFAGQIPLLTIKFDATDREGVAHGLSREVLAGEMDERLTLIAGVVRDAGRPVFVRIGPEVNGPWNNYDPALYPKAYRYIADLLTREGCDRVIRIWNVKYVPEQDRDAYLDWYPGDDVVDWWSVDLFREDMGFADGRAWVAAFLDRARAHGKPVIVPESCPNGMNLDSDRTWVSWFAPYFELINRDDDIKGFCYSNRDFGARDVQLTDWGDMRLDKHALKKQWRAELSKPQYLTEQPGAAEAIRAHYEALVLERGPEVVGAPEKAAEAAGGRKSRGGGR